MAANTNKSAPLIAIIGSLDDSRPDIEPPIKNTQDAVKAAESLGKQLAEQGCHICVYSCDDQFLEGHVVKGYVQSKKAEKGSIHVRYPNKNSSAIQFPAYKTHKNLFQLFPDNSDFWATSFYRSLKTADGMVLMGGGRSTFVAGQLGFADEIPMLAFAMFGGKSEMVWKAMASQSVLLEENDTAVMATQWDDDVAKKSIELLLVQRERLLEKQDEAANAHKPKDHKNTTAALISFVLCLAVLIGGYWVRSREVFGAELFLFCVFFTPFFAGGAGAIVQTFRGPQPPIESAYSSWGLGAIAGAISSILFFIAQLAANPNLLESTSPPFNLLLFTAAIGFVAGMTKDKVFGKLQKMDALKGEKMVSISAVKPTKDKTETP